MIINVTYNKLTGELAVNGDIDLIELNTNTIEDTSDLLSFEIAVNTAQYETANLETDQEIIEEV